MSKRSSQVMVVTISQNLLHKNETLKKFIQLNRVLKQYRLKACVARNEVDNEEKNIRFRHMVTADSFHIGNVRLQGGISELPDIKACADHFCWIIPSYGASSHLLHWGTPRVGSIHWEGKGDVPAG